MAYQTLDDLDSIIRLLNVASESQKRFKNKLTTDATSYQSRINDVRTLNDLNNMLPSVYSHNNKMNLSGRDEYSVSYKDKRDAFNSSNSAYSKGVFVLQDNLSNPDALAKNLLKGGWEGAAAGVLEMNNLLNDIEEGEKYKFKYVGDDQYSPKAIKDAIITRKAAYESVQELLDDPDNAKNFLVVNEDGTMDEDTAILLDKLKFNIVSGDVAEVTKTVNDGTTKAISDYSKYSNKYARYTNALLQKSSGKNTLEDMDFSSDDKAALLLDIESLGKSETDPLEIDTLEILKQNALENAQKANKRHKLYTGKIYDENPFYDKLEVDWDGNDMGLSNLNPNPEPIGLLEKEILDTSELSKEEKKKLQPAQNEKDADVTPLEKEKEVIKTEDPNIGLKSSATGPEAREAKIRKDFINSVLPEVSLKTKNRSDMLSYNWMDKNEQTMYNDVDKIVKIIGGTSETYDRKKGDNISSQQHKNVYDLYEKYLGGKMGLTSLRRVIDEYKKAPDYKKQSLAKKILTRYNTITSKIKQKSQKF